MGNHHYRITEVNQAADKLIDEGHTDYELISRKKDEVNEAWHRLNTLAATRYNFFSVVLADVLHLSNLFYLKV